MIENTLGWIANVFFIYGVYALGKRKVIGFYSCILGNILYIVQSILMSNSALFWLSILLVVLNAKGAWEWTSRKRILKEGYRKVRAKSKSSVSRKRARECARTCSKTKESKDVKSNCGCCKNKCP